MLTTLLLKPCVLVSPLPPSLPICSGSPSLFKRDFFGGEEFPQLLHGLSSLALILWYSSWRMLSCQSDANVF